MRGARVVGRLPLLVAAGQWLGVGGASAQDGPPVLEIADLTSVGSSVEWLRASPDGRHLVFTVRAESQTWVFDREAGDLRRLAMGASWTPVWSPTGLEIALSRRDSRDRQTVWTVAQAGRGALRRVSAWTADGPVYSPDGSSIAFNRIGADCAEGSGCSPALVVIPVRGGPEREIAACCSFPFAWSGDGRWIYYHRYDEGFQFERVPAAGGSAEPLFGIPDVPHHEVGLSPDGRYIALMLDPAPSGRLGTLAIWTAEGAEVLRLELPEGVVALSWSGSGRLIGVREERRHEMRSMNVDGTHNRLITRDWNHDFFPQFSPDGTRMRFAVGANDSLRIAVVRADGSGLRTYEATPRPNGAGIWSPDGEWIAYRSGRAPAPLREVVALNTATDRARTLASGPPGADPLVWTEDGASLLYQVRLEDTSPPRFELRAALIDGGVRTLHQADRPIIGRAVAPDTWWRIVDDDLLLLTEQGRQVTRLAGGVVAPAGVSADGRRFAAAVPPGPDDRTFRMIVGVDGRTAEITLPDGLRPSGRRVSWHPGGSHFLVRGCDPGCGNTRIVAVPTSGGVPRLLPVPSDHHVMYFDLSPDGRTLVYGAELPPYQTLVELDISAWLNR